MSFDESFARIYVGGTADSLLAVQPTNIVEGITNNPELLYSVSAVGALLVGSVVEGFYSRRIENRRSTLASVWGDIVEKEEPSRARRLRAYVASATTAGAILVGVSNTAVWAEAGSEEVVKPYVSVVVDRSGATAIGDQEPARSVSGILQELLDRQSNGIINAGAFVASTSYVEKVDLPTAKATVPFGDAQMQQAYDLAVDDAISSQLELTGGQEVPTNVAVVITNGNVITADPENGIPTFVINVSSSSKNAADLTEVAEATGGLYTENNKLDQAAIDTTIDQIIDAVEDNTSDSNNKPNWPSRIAVGAASAMSTVAYLLMRPRLTTSFGVKGKTKPETRRNG